MMMTEDDDVSKATLCELHVGQQVTSKEVRRSCLYMLTLTSEHRGT